MVALGKKNRAPRSGTKPLLAVSLTVATMISEDWLRQNSRPQAFAKAAHYAGDAVEILHWCDRQIIAEIYGSQPYTVSVRYAGKAVHADCTCPARHDWPGFCKHIIGLGFYIIACRDRKNDFPKLKDAIENALGQLSPARLSALCLDLAFMNRNFRDRILDELGIVFEPRNDREDYD